MGHYLEESLLGDSLELAEVAVQVAVLVCELLEIGPYFVVVVASNPLDHVRVIAEIAVIDDLILP